MTTRVIVAMSGGVDSSVAAALLAEQGYDVVGIAMRLASDAAPRAGSRASCCSYEDFEDARRVAERMDFPFYVIDLREEFAASVIAPFVGEYLSGRTPNPCLMCNRDIKFDRLWQRADALGADYVATGHYARIARGADGSFHLLKALDTRKDQSYFLFTLGQPQLSRTLFPLGAMSKDQVRARARELGLANADKPESQEICFVTDGDYASFVAARSRPEQIRAGSVVDSTGRRLAQHQGIHRFTVGQRRGLGVAGGEPLYVRRISPETGQVTVGPREALGAVGLRAARVNLVDPAIRGREALEVEVKIRYRHPAVPAVLKMVAEDRAEVSFARENPAVTPGQACVFYRGDEVLGGGLIEGPLEG
ncbi:MAG TPA: tRNA 2-thiouridine(34) synthase MnmA [Candidatus Binataceae bacterium]|nr:tRNA 2-thiouridine(34) synthase MnmA [Candidatus Binataceae bacterium]